ncbi:AMP-binding protein [Streptomyces californicus]|uniref:AMP-binding protein n=1 Tax=Streptomyces californicus TaxID=67351 RepID=UPI0037125C77
MGRGLRRRGIGSGDIVAVALPCGIDLLAAMIGIMASGAACVVLDDSWPRTRVDQVLADAGARLVVAAEPGPEADRSPRVSVRLEKAQWSLYWLQSRRNGFRSPGRGSGMSGSRSG